MGHKEEKEYLNREIELPCPGGGRDQRCKINQLIKRTSLETQKGEYKFKSTDQYKAEKAMRNLIRRKEKFEKEVERMEKRLGIDLAKLQVNYEEALTDILANAEKRTK
tara:strand:+ start:571 stop:894 length:324 start_codon:yes stop_codon:yes gene_type:complete